MEGKSWSRPPHRATDASDSGLWISILGQRERQLALFIKGFHFYPVKLHVCEKSILLFGPKVAILFGRCLKKSKKHAARTPDGDGGKEGGSEKSWGGVKVVRKVGIPCGRSRKKFKKHAARAPAVD